MLRDGDKGYFITHNNTNALKLFQINNPYPVFKVLQNIL